MSLPPSLPPPRNTSFDASVPPLPPARSANGNASGKTGAAGLKVRTDVPPPQTATPPRAPPKPAKFSPVPPPKPARVAATLPIGGGGSVDARVQPRNFHADSIGKDTSKPSHVAPPTSAPSQPAAAAAAAATNGATSQPHLKESTQHGFTLWAHNLGYACAILLGLFGIFGVLWADAGYSLTASPLEEQLLLVSRDPSMELSRLGAIYAIIMAAPVYLFEYKYGLVRGGEPVIDGAVVPVRGIGYILLSLPCFFSYPAMMAGIIMVCCGTANIIATTKGERVNRGTIKRGEYCLCASDGTGGWGKDKDPGTTRTTRPWSERLREVGQLSQLYFVGGFLVVNALLWIQSYTWWRNELPSNVVYAPFAKAFGQLLNFNCALILFPVLRALLRGLNNYQISPTRSIASYIPLRKNIIFHKFIAMVICFAVVGHVSFHYINFANESALTNATFGVLPWYSGYAITIAMVIIFAGAQARVKRAHYEIFWFSHHWFVVFFGMLLCHGPVFWMWSMIPILLYVSERVLRNSRGNKPFYLLAARYTKPVLMLEFFPKRIEDFNFREGQYLYLMAPALSRNEWHPFTISSPYGDLAQDPGRVTLHIRVQRPGSWTAQLRDHFANMAPPSGDPDHYELELTHIDSDGRRQRGKFLGPDGQPLICIDGPHAAPAQHYSVYSEVMLVGAGIGLTPAASIIQGILRHKWKKGFHPETIYFYWVVRHAEISSFQWFIDLLTELQRMVISDRAAGSITAAHRLEINIFVTSAPKGGQTREANDNAARASRQSPTNMRWSTGSDVVRAGFQVDVGFNEETLKAAIMNPKTSSKELPAVLTPVAEGGTTAPSAPNKLQDIYIWNGRPDWNEIFKTVKARRQQTTQEIGVAFCGAAVIGKDLKKNCNEHSSLAENCLFRLMKENF